MYVPIWWYIITVHWKPNREKDGIREGSIWYSKMDLAKVQRTR